jgi:regulator of PEP synthase PpsR (kinase-PPPase family)
MIPFVTGAVSGGVIKNYLPKEYYIETAVTSVVAVAGASVFLGISAPIALGGVVGYFAFDYFCTPYVVDPVLAVIPKEYANKALIETGISVVGSVSIASGVPVVVKVAPVVVQLSGVIASSAVKGITVAGTFLKKFDLLGKALEYAVPKLVGGSEKVTKVVSYSFKILGGWTTVSYFENLIGEYQVSHGKERLELGPVLKLGLTASIMYPGVGSSVLVTYGSSVGYFMLKKAAGSVKTASGNLRYYYNQYSSANMMRPYLHKGSDSLEYAVGYIISYVNSKKDSVHAFTQRLDDIDYPMMTPVALLVPVSLGMPLALALGFGVASISDVLERDYEIKQASELNKKMRVTGDFIWTMVPNKYELLTTNGVQAAIELLLGTWLHQFDKDPASKSFVRDGTKIPSSIMNVVFGNEVGGTGIKYGTGSALSAILKPVCKFYIMSNKYPGLNAVDVANFANYVCEVPARLLHLLDVQQQRDDSSQNQSFVQFAYDKTSLELTVFALAESIMKTYAVSQFSKAIGSYKPYSEERNVVAAKLKHIKEKHGDALFTEFTKRLQDEINDLPHVLKQDPVTLTEGNLNSLAAYVTRHHKDLGNKVIIHGGKISFKMFQNHDYNIPACARLFAFRIHSFVTRLMIGHDATSTSHDSAYSHVMEAWKHHTNPMLGVINVGVVVTTEVSFKMLNEAFHMSLLATSAKAMQDVTSQSIVASGIMNVTLSNKKMKPEIQKMVDHVITPSVDSLKSVSQGFFDNVSDTFGAGNQMLGDVIHFGFALVGVDY